MVEADEELITLFKAYAEYIGHGDVDKLDRRCLQVWLCDDCGVKIPVNAGDPQAYGPVMCPDCGEICEVQSLR